MSLTQEEAHRLFEYRDGSLFWRERPKTSCKPKEDAEAGTASGHGYRKIRRGKKTYYVHQLIFLMQHGYIPEVVDHIDGNKSNNYVENLRASSKSLNACNSKLPSHNTSGTKGVIWLKRECKWVARVQINKKVIHLGTFDDIELASLVSDEARRLYHGEHAKI
jgi:hypothetical protein